MDAQQILKQAWKAVEEAGIPESLQEAAFREAVEILKGGDGGASAARQGNGGGAAPSKTKTQTQPKRGASTRRGSSGRGGRGTRQARTTAETPPVDVPDEDTFFSRIATESGASEKDLRDLFNLTADGKVQIIPPTKDLGSSVADQARTVIVLVAGARAKGLEEKPVSADPVRDECDRKHCYQRNNFSHKHLGPLKGFNAGSDSTEILLTSKWVDEFTAAVDKAHGRKPDANAS